MKRHKPFIDHTTIIITAGDGGNGCVSFATRRGGAKLGADGGHGGRGGDVILVAQENLSSLSSLFRGRIYKAAKGGDGTNQKKKGAQGKALNIPIPLGCDIYDHDSHTLLGTLSEDQETLCVARGGRGGLGNVAFLSPTNQRPRTATPGKPGESRRLRIELKLIAHVGLAGFPNAGKSTLLRALSHSKTKTGHYPFTTLTPELGVLEYTHSLYSYSRWIIADVPGLVIDSSQGKGLGHEFLKHLERTRLIALVIKVGSQKAIHSQIQALQNELRTSSATLENIPKILIITHMDTISQTNSRRSKLQAKLSSYPWPSIMISAHSGEGIPELKKLLINTLEKLHPPAKKSNHASKNAGEPSKNHKQSLTAEELAFLQNLLGEDVSIATH